MYFMYYFIVDILDVVDVFSNARFRQGTKRFHTARTDEKIEEVFANKAVVRSADSRR